MLACSGSQLRADGACSAKHRVQVQLSARGWALGVSKLAQSQPSRPRQKHMLMSATSTQTSAAFNKSASIFSSEGFAMAGGASISPQMNKGTSSNNQSIASNHSRDASTNGTTLVYNNVLPIIEQRSFRVSVAPGSVSVFSSTSWDSNSSLQQADLPASPCEVHGAAATALGRKRCNEDHYSLAILQQSQEAQHGWMYGAVFDGHGGDGTASCLAKLFHHGLDTHLLQQHKKQQHALQGKQQQEHLQQFQVHAAVREAFLSFDTYWRRRCHDNSGSTAVVSLLNGNNLLVANAGDSVAVLGTHGTARRLSVCHKPENPDEAARIRASGGIVEQHPRISGMLRAMHDPTKLSPEERIARQSLGVTRGFGDYSFKRPDSHIVTAEPDIVQLQLQPADQLLLLTSDGVTDVLYDHSMVQVAMQAIEQAQDFTNDGQQLAHAAATAVKDTALRMGAVDNVTVVAMLLKWGD